MQRLSGLDAAFLYLETPSTPMHTMGVLLLGARRPPLSIDDIESLLLDRMHHLPALRQRVLDVPFGLDHPVWVEDPDFEIGNHVWHVHWDEPGTLDDLDWAAGVLASIPLDRRHPLWQACWFEELDDGGSALIFKVHHALIDGVSSARFMGQLLDPRPAGPPDRRAGHSRPVVASPISLPRRSTLALHAVRHQAQKSAALARGAVGLPRAIRDHLRDAAARRNGGEARIARDWLSPQTHFNGSLSRQRVITRTSASLEEFRFIKQAFDTTINDALLAAVSLAFIRYFATRRDAFPSGPLRAAIPVSTRCSGESPGGNRVSTLFVDLPVHPIGVEEVIRSVQRATRNAKEVHAVLPPEFIETALEYAPPAALKWIARQHERLGLADHHRPLCNLIVSNFPGPPMPLYCAGALVRAAYPFGPLMNGSGMNLTVMSYDGRMDLGLISCPRRMPDAASFLVEFGRAIEMLCEAGSRVARPSLRRIQPNATGRAPAEKAANQRATLPVPKRPIPRVPPEALEDREGSNVEIGMSN